MKILTAIAAAALLLGGSPAHAGNLAVPHDFVEDTPALAAEVNNNFTAVESAVNDNDARIGVNEAARADHETRIGSNETRIGVNETARTDHETRIGVNEAARTDHETRIGTNESDLLVQQGQLTDHEARVSALEAGTSTIGRLFIPPKAIDTALADGARTVTLSGIADTLHSVVFGRPIDYVSGGTNDVRFRLLLSGCSDPAADVLVQAQAWSYIIGAQQPANPMFLGTPVTPNAAPGVVQVMALDFIASDLGDLNYLEVRRLGTDVTDVCDTDLELRGIVIEYPTVPPAP